MIPCRGTGKFKNILCLLEKKRYFRGCQVALKGQRNQVIEPSCNNLSIRKSRGLIYVSILFLLLSVYLSLRHLRDIVKNGLPNSPGKNSRNY